MSRINGHGVFNEIISAESDMRIEEWMRIDRES